MEEWKDIKDYEGLYQVSNEGRVKSVDRIINSNNKIIHRKGKILKNWKNECGYYSVYLSNCGKNKCVTVHRLVAKAFIPNPENKRDVDHINTIRTDNRVENLRWATHKENANNPISIEHYKSMPPTKGMFGKHHSKEARKKMSEAKKGKKHYPYGKHLSRETVEKIKKSNSKKVYQYTLCGKLVKIWESTAECGRNGYNQGNVCRCCNGTLKNYKNYNWAYKN